MLFASCKLLELIVYMETKLEDRLSWKYSEEEEAAEVVEFSNIVKFWNFPNW